MAGMRDVDIDVELEVDASELLVADALIDDLIENIKRIDDTIKINVDLDILDALQDLTQLQSIIEALEAQTIKVKIDVDIAQAQAKLALLQHQINSMSGESIPIIVTSNGTGNNGPPQGMQDMHATLHLDTDNAVQELVALRARLQEFDDVLNIELNVDIDGAMTKLAVVEAKLATMRTHTINIDVDMGVAMAQLTALQTLTQLLSNSGGGAGNSPIPSLPIPNIGGVGKMFNPAAMIIGLAGLITKLFVVITALQALASVVMVAVGAIGTLGVALGLLASGALAVGGAFAVAFSGIGGAAAFVIPSIKALYDENAKLNALQKETKTHIDSLKNAWGRFVDANQATALDLTTHGVNVLKTALTMLEPVLTSGANAIDILFHNLDAALQDERMTAFFDSLQRQIPQMTEWIGNGLGNIGQTIANLMTAFEPLTMWAGEGFTNMMKGMADWSFDLQGSEKLTAFIDYVKTNLPTLGSGLGDAAQGVLKFFAAFDDTASSGIEWFADTMSEFDTWASGLGENQGFQDMLSDIETMAPKVAEAIGLISDSVMDLVDHLANGSGMDTILTVLEAIERTTSGENFLGKMFFNDKARDLKLPENTSVGALAMKGVAGFLFGSGEDKKITANLDIEGIRQQAEGAFYDPLDVHAQIEAQRLHQEATTALQGGTPFKIDAEVGDVEVPPMTQPVEVPATITLDEAGNVVAIEPIEVPATVGELDVPPTTQSIEVPATVRLDEAGNIISIDPVEVPATVSDVTVNQMAVPKVDVPITASRVDTSAIGPVRLPVSPEINQMNNFKWPPFPTFTFPPLPVFTFPPLPVFTFPPLPVFTWPALPKWTWPPFPKFSWPAYPKFTWPPMPKVTVNVAGADGSHSNGLGRVPFDGYIGELHKDEAILTATQAGALRSMGMLKGDGERPTLDMSATSSGSSPTYVTAAQPSASSSTTIQVGDVHITVQGGDNPQQTAINVREEFEKFFASLNDTIDLRAEG